MQATRREFLSAAAGMTFACAHLTTHAQASIGSGPAISPALQAQLLQQIDVLGFLDDLQAADVKSGKGSVDVTAQIQACLDSPGAVGRTIRMPAGTYRMGRVFLRSGIALWMDQGVVLRKRENGGGLLRLTHVENVHVFCNGAVLDATAPEVRPSHTVYFESARDCSIRDAMILGSGPRGDCIYVGEGTQGPSEHVLIVGGTCANALRNGISVVSGRHTVIDGVEIFGTTGAPGAGIDVEANEYDRATDTEIRNCRIYGNATFGIVVIFADGVNIHHNTIYDNVRDGIGSTAGGAAFKPGVYRPNIDIRGVSGFDPATGRVVVGGDIDKLPIGTVVLFNTSGGATLPATFRSQVRWVVCEKSSAGILLGEYLDYGVKTTLTDAGSGLLSKNPAVSQVRMVCYMEGQSSNLDIHDNVVYGNGRRGINVGASVNVSIANNKVRHGGLQEGIHVSFARAVQVSSNQVQAVSPQSTTRGLFLLSTSNVRTNGNLISGFPSAGIDAAGTSGALMEGDTVVDCGSSSGVAVQVRYAKRVRVSRMKISNVERSGAAHGLKTTSVADSVFRQVDARGAGSSNANSISVEANRVEDSRVRDGSAHRTGSRP